MSTKKRPTTRRNVGELKEKEPTVIESQVKEEVQAEKPEVKEIESPINHLAKINPEAKTFIGGLGISDYVRNSELYISRVNPNGTVMISSSETLTEINLLFAKDVQVLDEKRTYHDEEHECPNISIRIFGVPERMECIKLNQKRLGIPDELIFIDEKHEGVIPTAKRAWSYPTDKPFVLVLQDDVELCDNFMHYLNVISETQPDSIISLFSTQFSKHLSVNRIPDKSPYIATKILTAQGIMMKTEYVEPCISSWKENVKGDDTNIQAWANENEIQILATIPTILQHIGDVSVFDRSRSMGRSDFYRKSPIDAHWDNSYVTQWSNIKR